MSPLLMAASAAMVIALTLYTVGVWGERLVGQLRPWHLAVFWAGLTADTVGTELMRRLAGGDFALSLHSLTGLVALLLMAAHALWASLTLLRREPAALRDFHRLSTAVWLLWLVPFALGGLLNSGLLLA